MNRISEFGIVSRARENVADDGISDMAVDKAFPVRIVGVADRPIIVEHAFSAMGNGIFQLVLMKRIGPPFLEQLGITESIS